MGNKDNRYFYLQQQVVLLEFLATCLFTKEEDAIYSKMGEAKDAAEKKILSKQLTELIKRHEGPRTVNNKSLVDVRLLPDTDEFKEYYIDEDGNRKFHYITPEYVDYNWIKIKYRVSEFCSELSRCVGVNPGETFYDKIVIEWKSLDSMSQIVKDGFWFKYIDAEGNKKEKFYKFWTASASNLRTKRFQMLSEEAYNRVYKQVFNGLTEDIINASGGVNVSKLLAYRALPGSATARWKNPDGSKFSIRNCIVVPDYNTKLNIEIDYVQTDKIEHGMADDIVINKDGSHGVDKNAADGCGVVLPGVLPDGAVNSIIRSSWIKGLLGTFDFVKFCEVNNIPCKCKDYWGLEHDLVKENIKVIMTESMLKMAGKYDSWEQYCSWFEENDCWLCTMKPEAARIEDCDTDANYQYCQSLLELTNKNIDDILELPMLDVEEIYTNKTKMLNICGADINSPNAAQRCLALYNQLLKHEFFRETLKQTKAAKLRQLKSSSFEWNAKRVFCLPDLYAFCEYLFMNIQNPKGLIPANQCVYAYKAGTDIAAMRSPSLFIDGVILRCIENTKEPAITNPYYWMNSNAIYISSHDGAYLSLNLDFDGDELCIIDDEIIIEALRRTKEKYFPSTCYYPGVKAPKQMINSDTFVWAIQTASRFNIGKISNMLTKLWNNSEFIDAVNDKNKEVIDRFLTAGKYLLLKNQGEIDGAKTGESVKLSKDVETLIESCIGTRRHPQPLPYFFKFTDNFTSNTLGDTSEQRKIKESKLGKFNDSVCNTICHKVEDYFSTRKDYDYSKFDTYDGRMFLDKDINVSAAVKEKVLDIFYRKNCIRKASAVDDVVSYLDGTGSSASARDLFVCNLIVKELIENNISEDEAYAAIASHIFVENMEKMSYVRLFFIIFGKKCEEILRNNIKNKTYTDAPLDKFQAKCSCCGCIISSKRKICESCKGKDTKAVLNKHKYRDAAVKNDNDSYKNQVIKIINRKITISSAMEAALDLKSCNEKIITYDFIAEEINKKFGTSYTGRQIRKINSGRK